MFIPSTIPYISQFYPLGNTPAVSLTRGLPQGIDADILLLGCGDVRNILFTAYSERGFPPRKLDITCCDMETAIIARNVLLFTLLIDGISADNAWDVYFNLRINEDLKTLIKDQAQKLVSLSSSIGQWSEGRYGSVLRFCDSITLQQVRQIWAKYASPQKGGPAFDEDLGRARKLERTLDGLPEGHSKLILTGLRSTAPLSLAPKLASTQEVIEAREVFWKRGNFSRRPEAIPNPIFSETLSPNTYIHYGTDPILGFHLATAMANLAPASPLRPIKEDDDETLNVIRAAKTQFYKWVAAFQEIPENRISLRFTVSDALSFCHGLQAVSASVNLPVNLYRRQLDTTSVEFDPTAYTEVDSAPTRFDVIDTSNLADHLGTLNLLVAATPLLKTLASSTLWVETLLKSEKTRKQQFDALLRGHGPTLSLLLGLSPVDFWTNATSVSCVDELVMNAMYSSSQRQQAHSRLAFKLDRYFSQLKGSAILSVEPHALAKAAFQVYTQLFDNEDPTSLLTASREEAEENIRRHGYPLFHRGSFATLMRHVQTNTSTNWPSFWEQLLQMVDQDDQNQTTLRKLYRQDLGAQLHLHGLYTEPWLRAGVKSNPSLGGFNAWRNIPEVVCITVAVPRKQIDNLYSTDLSKLNAPTLEGVLRSSNPFGWQNMFGNVHCAFGQVETKGNREAEDFSITVRQDPLGWQGESSLIASFHVPSGALQVEPRDAKVGLSIQNTAMNITTFRHMQPTMTVYMTTLSDTSNVFVTKYEPGMSGYPFTSIQTDREAGGSGVQTDAPTTTQIIANFEDNKIKSLCGHVDFSTSQRGKKLLADRASIELRQSSPFSIDIVFGKKLLVCPVSFPTPVLQETAKTRIARTSCYIEVIAPLADPLTSGPLSSFIYPVTLGEESIPIPLNSQQVNLDSLPIVDVDQAHKKDNNWLNILTAHQFSLRERRLRDSAEPTLRMNFKESLFSMFMLASGLQGGNTGLFALQHPKDGNQILIFIRAIRLNGAEGSVVADAAAMPLTRQLIDSGELETFLYVLRELEICAINVNDEELVLWKKVLPALAERCRTWSHGPECEYKKPGATIPLSTEMGKQFMCSCGNGVLPEGFMKLPEWDDAAAKHAVRVAISPTFSVPFVEDIVDTSLLKAQGGIESLQLDKCRNCNATEGKNGGKLLKCSRCREVMYCSYDCQRKDWKKHRMECVPYDVS
ncbi:hypothetical protein F5Y05DRAFT_412278 [Hypoxylon sp. FL0543]|nr:hypothetical protein F5Y05DRAFT_412278 [Hypoxylon sp. FL0543]